MISTFCSTILLASLFLFSGYVQAAHDAMLEQVRKQLDEYAAAGVQRIMLQWLDLDDSGRVVNQAVQEGKTVTLGAEPLTWDELDAAAGSYVLGFIVEDLDGNSKAAYAPVTVE